MRKFVFWVLSTLVCLTFGLRTVNAQGNEAPYITLTVKRGENIKLDFAASTPGVKVKVTGVEGEKEEEAPSSLHSYDKQPKYKATGTKIKVYGAIDQFTCYKNGKNLTALDVSQNVNLRELRCWDNQLSSLDVRQNDKLTLLECSYNQLSRLDVSKNVNLLKLFCSFNQLSKLDVAQNEKLTDLGCSENQLTSLDVSQNRQLAKIWVYGNNFSTSTLNDIFCQLPDRSGQTKGFIYPVNKVGDVIDDLLAKSTSKQIANSKNWAIQYWQSDSDIYGITGSHTCGSVYALTLEPATISNFFNYQGDEWVTTVTSSGRWEIDESTRPDWLNVAPKQGYSGRSVTITFFPNQGSDTRRGAVTFMLADDNTTKQVVIVRQNAKPPLVVNPAATYTFAATGEKKENYFTVESSGAWKVTSTAGWLHIEPKEGEAGKKNVTIKAETNSGDARTAELTFAHKDNSAIRVVVTLKQQGKAETPNPNAVEDAQFADVTVSPNPFHNQLRIANGSLEGEYILLNAQGVKVASGALKASETIVNTSKLSAGIYLLQLNAAGGPTKTYRVVK